MNGKTICSLFLKQHQPWTTSFRSGRIFRRKSIASFKTEEEYEKTLVQKAKGAQIIKKTIPKLPPIKNVEKPKSGYEQLKYKRSSGETDHMFAKMIKSMKTKKYKEFNEVCLLQGEFLINEAIEAGCFMRTIYFNNMSLLEKLPLHILHKCTLISISRNYLKVLTDHSSEEGLFAVITQQDARTRQKIIKMRTEMIARKERAKILPISVICDGIQSPSQLGDILKAAAFTGCDQVFVTEDCCNIWNKSVVESSQGAHFNIPVIPDMNWERLENLFELKQPGRIFISHDACNGLNMNSFKTSEKSNDTDNTEGIFETLKKDGNLKSLEEDIESLTIPSVMYDQVRLTHKSLNNVIIFGKPTVDWFEFAANLQQHGCESFVLNLPKISKNSKVTSSIQANVFLVEARRQKNKMDLIKQQIYEQRKTGIVT